MRFLVTLSLYKNESFLLVYFKQFEVQERGRVRVSPIYHVFCVSLMGWCVSHARASVAPLGVTPCVCWDFFSSESNTLSIAISIKITFPNSMARKKREAPNLRMGRPLTRKFCRAAVNKRTAKYRKYYKNMENWTCRFLA